VAIVHQGACQAGYQQNADSYVVSSGNSKDDDKISDNNRYTKRQSLNEGTMMFFLKSHNCILSFLFSAGW
jgi:hypothetical protein